MIQVQIFFNNYQVKEATFDLISITTLIMKLMLNSSTRGRNFILNYYNIANIF